LRRCKKNAITNLNLTIFKEAKKMNPNDPKKPSVPPRSNRNENDFFQKKGNESLKVPPGDPNSEERNARKLDSLYGHGTPNQEQIITYVILVIGLVTVFINTLVGGLILGGVVGYFFAPEVIYYLKNVGQLFNSHDPIRYIVIVALLIGLFIAAPGFFLGAIIAAAVKHLLFNEKGTA
jgi:hypothetical protein